MIARRHRALIAQLIAVALLVGSMPMAASPVLSEQKSTPAFTLDICHLLPAFALGAASCTLAAVTAYSFSIMIEDRGRLEATNTAVADRVDEAPDPPPPKPLA